LDFPALVPLPLQPASREKYFDIMNTKLVSFLASLALLTATTAHTQSVYSNAVLNLNPTAYWPLQETAQPPTADVETNLGSLGVVADAYYSSTNAAQGFTPGAISGDPAVSFSGLNGSFLAVPLTDNRVSLPVGAFSVEAWVYPTNTTAAAIIAQTGPLGKGGLNEGPDSAGWSLNYNYVPSVNDGNFGGWTFHVYNGTGPVGGAEAVAPTLVTLNTWYHIAAVFDGTNCLIYVNGVDSDASHAPINGTYVQDTWDPLTIGCGYGLNNSRFGGAIDEVAIYTNTLTAAKILNHYHANSSGNYAETILGDNPYMYWRMDAPAPNPASNFPHATSYGSINAGGLYLEGVTCGAAGPQYPGFGGLTNACAFNGLGSASANQVIFFTNGVPSPVLITANSGILITNLDSSLNQTNTAVTAMVWFKANPVDGRFQNLVGHGNNSWRIALDGTTGKLHWNPGEGGEITSAGTYNDGQWHFAAGVYLNGGTVATGTNYLYVDGALDSSATVTTNAPGSITNNVLIGGAPDYVLSGNGNTYNQRFFAGSLAHVAYFNYALTAAQIINLYTNANPHPPSPVIFGQPAGAVAAGGSHVAFNVAADGISPLSYQWYYHSSSNYDGATMLADGTKYFGSETSALTVTNLAGSDNGYYFVVITNNYGSVTSVLANLQVSAAPVITAQNPAGPFSLFPNQNFTLSVAASGVAPLTYLWYTNGVADTTLGTSSAYPVSGTQLSMSGTAYQCVVTNSAGSTTGTLDTLTVQSFPAALLNDAYSSNLLALKPEGYWPLHEVDPAVPGDVEANLGSLGVLADGYYADWSMPGSNVTRQIVGALAGDTDTAVNFYGTGGSGTGYMLVPRTVQTGLTPPFTVEAWVNPLNPVFGDIISQYGYGVNANNTGNNYGFRLMWAPGNFEVGFGNGTNSGFSSFTGTGRPAGQWYHVAVTYDGTTALLYVNGQQDASGALPFSYDPSIPLTIGSGFWSKTGPTRGFDGSIDEVAVYTNLLSQADISQHYSDGINPSPATSYFHDVTNDHPILYYRMDSPAYVPPSAALLPVMTNYGTVGMNGVYDPGSLPGALATGPNAPANLIGAHVMPGNGLSSFADAGYSPVYNPTGRVPITVTCWFKANPADSRFQILFGNDSTWRCAMDGTVGRVHFNAGAGGEITSAKVYNDGNWHQLVGVYTGTTAPGGNNLLYVDGMLDTQLSTATTAVAANTSHILMFSDPQYTNNPIGLGRQFSGSVCDVAFWTNTILSASQVQALYNSAGVAPYVLTQPTSGRMVDAGTGTYIYFGVVPNGSTPFSYQWYFNNSSNYNGATPLANGAKYSFTGTSQLTVTNLGGSDSGYYFVVITNNFGSVTSELASLTVDTTPIFTAETPITYTNLFTLFAGASPTFSVTAIGAQPIYYQWFTNGVAVSASGTSSSFTLTNVQKDFTIYCVAMNTSGSTTNSNWNASVIADPTAPYPQVVLGDHPVGYWRLDEGSDNGDGNEGIVCHDYMGGNDGIYTNVNLGQSPGYSSTDPETAVLFGEAGINGDYQDSLAAWIQGVDFAAPSGTTTNFTVETWVNGYPASQSTGSALVSKGVYSLNDAFVFDYNSVGPHYLRFYVRSASGTVYNCTQTNTAADGLWHHLVGVCDESDGLLNFYIDGNLASSSPIPSTAGLYEPNYPMSIGAVQNSSETASYSLQFYGFINDVAVYNYALTATQVAAHFAASGTAPTITQEPVASTNADAGGTVKIAAGVNGSTPLSLQWYDNQQAVPGQTNATLVISNITTVGNYYLTANNAYGSATSSGVTVNVISGAPQISANITPPGRSAYVGNVVTFSITAFGTAPLSYQWRENGAPVAGATNSSYAATAVLGQSTYSCVISNAYNGGSIATSATAILTGVTVPTDPYSQAVLDNGPIAYWPLDESSGVIAYDYVGGHDALYTNVDLGVPGNPADPNTAALFGTLTADNSFAGEIDNSTNDIPNIDFSGMGTAEFSVEAWINGGSSQVSSAGIVAKGYSGAEQFCLDYYNNGFRFFVRDGLNEIYTCQSTVSLDGNWHHLAGVCDELNGRLHLYVDGTDVADASIQAGKSVHEPSGATVPAADLIGIGARAASQTATSFTDQFAGTIDDVAVYNYALAPSQVATDYQAGSAPAVNTNPTNIISTVSGNQLTLTWPADHIGWELQVQTNNLSKGLGTNWVNVSGSTTTDQVSIPMNPTNGCVFYRLVYPAQQ
jgi:Concanavalin A-like lectin/glucanases superfamily/Immunoglobulin I-set domain